MEEINLDNLEQLKSMDLIQQAKEMGLFDSNLTLKCVHCSVMYPKEYDKCPQCNANGT